MKSQCLLYWRQSTTRTTKNNDDDEDEGRSVELVKERKGVENVKSNERRRDSNDDKM